MLDKKKVSESITKKVLNFVLKKIGPVSFRFWVSECLSSNFAIGKHGVENGGW